jgi:AcrR family transcriptional regulator
MSMEKIADMAARPARQPAPRSAAAAAAPPELAAPPPAGKSARERILETASELFFRHGIRAVGIDTIIARSGVAKMSLYRHFASKDDLVVAFLEWRNRTYWEWWDAVLVQHPRDPRAQLKALIQGIAERIGNRFFRGCAFLNTASEFPTPADGREHPAHAVSLLHKTELRRRLLDLATALAAREPELLADQLLLLFNGAYATAPLLGAEWPRGALDAALDSLIAAQQKR